MSLLLVKNERSTEEWQEVAFQPEVSLKFVDTVLGAIILGGISLHKIEYILKCEILINQK